MTTRGKGRDGAEDGGPPARSSRSPFPRMPMRRRDGDARGGAALRGVLVAVNGNELDERVVRLACETIKGSKTPLYVVHVIEMPWREAVDESPDDDVAVRADGILRGAQVTALGLGYTLEPELLQARAAGTAIVDEAAARDCDLIVLGLPYKAIHGHFTLGDTVPYVLEHSPVQVWLVRGKQP